MCIQQDSMQSIRPLFSHFFKNAFTQKCRDLLVTLGSSCNPGHLFSYRHVSAPRRAFAGRIRRYLYGMRFHNCVRIFFLCDHRHMVNSVKEIISFQDHNNSVKLSNSHLIYVFDCGDIRTLRPVR